MNISKILSALSAFSIIILGISAVSAEHHAEKAVKSAVETVKETAKETVEKANPVKVAKKIVTKADGEFCTDLGPQNPRDISAKSGKNNVKFPIAPSYKKMNLCNIHTHTNAEHKGPGFNLFVKRSDHHGGYACNETESLTKEELRDPFNGKGAFKGVAPGDTIEVHWVHTSCDIKPGKGLGSCLSDSCTNPTLRVEAQIFLVVNDNSAPSFEDYAYDGTLKNGFHQAKSIPSGTGEPVVFRGSTTGPKYTQKECSPLKVTWSVRPQCMKLNIASLHKWAEKGNIFQEDHSHGIRPLVTHPGLLAPIE